MLAGLPGGQPPEGRKSPAMARAERQQGASKAVAYKQAHGPVPQVLPQYVLAAHDAQRHIVVVHNLLQVRSVA